MRIPYTIIHIPDGYELDADTRTAFIPPINLAVEASSKAAAEVLLKQMVLQTLKEMHPSDRPEYDDWIPGDETVEVNP